MDPPFGHHHHRHHRPEPEEEYPNPDPNSYPTPADEPYGYQPPPPQPPPQQYYGQPEYFPPPVEHVSHVVRPDDSGYGYDNLRPDFFPSPVEHVSHVRHDNELPLQRTVRIFTKAAEEYSLSIRDGNVVLVPADPRDDYQHWIKDLRYSTKVKDEEGLPSFALVNKITGEAIKHAIGATHPVRLVPYKPDYLDESVLWTESHDTGEDFRCIRMVNNIGLNFDAFNGDEDHGGVRDGTIVVLWEWVKGKNQRWKIVPY